MRSRFDKEDGVQRRRCLHRDPAPPAGGGRHLCRERPSARWRDDAPGRRVAFPRSRDGQRRAHYPHAAVGVDGTVLAGARSVPCEMLKEARRLMSNNPLVFVNADVHRLPFSAMPAWTWSPAGRRSICSRSTGSWARVKRVLYRPRASDRHHLRPDRQRGQPGRSHQRDLPLQGGRRPVAGLQRARASTPNSWRWL